VVQTISKLRKQGIKFSIDDFGTGHSVLGYLNKYDIDFVKIDKSFVSDIETNNYNRIMCESIISMSHKLGIKLIAEGVENVEQQKILNSLGCDYFQGYLFERPIPIASFINKYSKKDIN
jgi:EAL domain-containing protein (putative c-di-GMP-specific phosphodiesterase class I)